MKEEEIYVAVKWWLKRESWDVLGGQPPSGTDHLPVIEIKDDLQAQRGSLGAYKPDLVAMKGFVVALIECKPNYDLNDHQKLNDVLSSWRRLRSLWNEICLRYPSGVVSAIEFKDIEFVGILAHSSVGTVAPLRSVGLLRCAGLSPAEIELVPAQSWAANLGSSGSDAAVEG